MKKIDEKITEDGNPPEKDYIGTMKEQFNEMRRIIKELNEENTTLKERNEYYEGLLQKVSEIANERLAGLQKLES